MPYADVAHLSEYLGLTDVPVPDEAEAVQVLSDASRSIDRTCGVPVDEDGGDGFDLDSLNAGQVRSLNEACLRTALWMLVASREVLSGDSEYIPSELAVEVQPISRSLPNFCVEPLAGAGLMKRSGTVQTPPPVAA